MHKESKWAKEIIAMQDEEGKWGYFHTLFSDSTSPYTTEKALRRLEILGFTIEDACIQKAVSYMSICLEGTGKIPDRREKLHDWDIFTSLMLAAWIRRFTKKNDIANITAQKWAGIVTTAFADGEYNHQSYIDAYGECFGMKPKGGRLVDFVQFYTVSILSGCLDQVTEAAMVRYILNKSDGIYYVYDRCIRILPTEFAGKKVSRYLSAIELLTEYEYSKEHLTFITEWIETNRNENGKWDLGRNAGDGLYLPLSDDWRRQERREADCTERIERLLKKLR